MSEDQIGQLKIELDYVKRKLDQVDRTLTEVRDRVWTTHLCPKPGACIELEAWVKNHNEKFQDHEQRMRSLEIQNNRMIGAAIIINIVAVAAMKYL
jgi:hypothetical protein